MAGNRNDIIPSVVPNWEKIPPLGGNIIWRQLCDYNWCVCVCVCGGVRGSDITAFSGSATKHPTTTGQLPSTQHFLTLNVSCAMAVNFGLYLKSSYCALSVWIDGFWFVLSKCSFKVS